MRNVRIMLAVVVLTVLGATGFAQSIGELTLRSEDGMLIHFYDSPEKTLERLGISGEMPASGPNGKQYHREDMSVFVIRLSLPNEEIDYALYELEVREGWETIRGIGVGSHVEDVLEEYPEVTLYVPGEIVRWSYDPGKRIPEGLVGYVYWDFGTKRRVTQWDSPVDYGFRFFFDGEGVVENYQMDYIVTEP